jgi:pimeloyl-ACP methyl ester carboxylesterase
MVKLAAIIVASALGATAPGWGDSMSTTKCWSKSGYFDSHGARIHYTMRGQGTPVILLHGFAINSDINWRLPGTFYRLAKSHQVIAMDLRGHGHSDKPGDDSAYGTEMAWDVIRLMDHLGLPKAHLCGYSMGGFIAIRLLTAHPERFLSVTACGAGWMQEGSEDAHLLEQVAADLRDHGTYRQLIQMLRPEGETAGMLRIFFMDAGMRTINDTAAMAAVAQSFSQLAVTKEELEKNQIPVLLIIGSQDPIKRSVDALEFLPEHRTCVLDGATHTTTMWRRELQRQLCAFIAQNDPS